VHAFSAQKNIPKEYLEFNEHYSFNRQHCGETEPRETNNVYSWLKMQNKLSKDNPHISSLDKPPGVTEFFENELELNFEKVCIKYNVDPQELLEKGLRLHAAWYLWGLCMSRNKTGIHAPAEDGGPGHYGNQRQREEGVGAIYAPATDGGPGNRGHQAMRERYKDQDYTNDALNRDMRGSTQRVGGVRVKCAYLCNGQACMKDGFNRVNGLYWCCQVHINCFNHWEESQRNEYKDQGYTNDALNRDMRGSTQQVGGKRVQCAYLSNGQACMKDGREWVNRLYWCCRVHFNCFNHWEESQRNEYN
jgi:hypothetical protein